MDLLTISDNQVIPSAYTLTIPEFKVLSAKVFYEGSILNCSIRKILDYSEFLHSM